MSRRAIKLISIMGKAAMEPYRIPGGLVSKLFVDACIARI
jgi:hypothetical protein